MEHHACNTGTLKLVTCVLACVGLVPALTGCSASEQRRQQLQRVAKDWCETIRASQVIPVYPLTEDLRPGDVFLVRTPISRQQSEWKERGFLALDDFRTRLRPEGKDFDNAFTALYFNGYFKDSFGSGPHDRPNLGDPGPLDGETPAEQAKASREKLSSVRAPRVAFPSYSFKVRQGTGSSLAIPIKGVPVGLSFMRSSNADGIVSIADAYTYAADPSTLYGRLDTWARQPKVQEHLADAARQNPAVFLRVVSRVYLTGSVAVTLTSRDLGGASGKAGAADEIKIFNDTNGFEESYKNLIAALDAQANKPFSFDEATKKLKPGAAVKFTWASERSVSMNESFDTPLVVGYLGFDVPVDAEGRLGLPLPTWGVLNADVEPRALAGRLTTTERETQIRLDAWDSSFLSGATARGIELAAKVSEGLQDFPEFKRFAQSARQLARDIATPAPTVPDNASPEDVAKAEAARAAKASDEARRVQLLRASFRDEINFMTAREGRAGHARFHRLFDGAYAN